MAGWKEWVAKQSLARILLTKTSSAIYVREALSVLSRELPSCQIILWTEERESEEFYQHPSVAKIILYRNLRAIPLMLREIASCAPYLVVTERTFEPSYDKMRIFSCVLLRGSGIVLDDSMRVVAFGSWPGRLAPTIGEVVATTLRRRMNVRSIAFSVARFLVYLASILAAPVVLLVLLGGAARIEIRRRIAVTPRSVGIGQDYEN